MVTSLKSLKTSFKGCLATFIETRPVRNIYLENIEKPLIVRLEAFYFSWTKLFTSLTTVQARPSHPFFFLNGPTASNQPQTSTTL